ncbi:hypothetical protein SLEP1_g48315 [Rubroshorea leprosula]|uniref:Uncharacterized protein n=1 Tax=Rubroshorea leprosula TaxID=152421 RepID=A0AAV5LVJ9_9ROSI|nr:hypothetical protein SLEP1_g48315 [Rubroshorea leprosula]
MHLPSLAQNPRKLCLKLTFKLSAGCFYDFFSEAHHLAIKVPSKPPHKSSN